MSKKEIKKIIITMIISMILSLIIGFLVIFIMDRNIVKVTAEVNEMNIRYHEPSGPPSEDDKDILQPIEIDGELYDEVIKTRDDTVIKYTTEIAEKYQNIDPLLIQALIFYESSNNPEASNGKCKGYMQIYEKWHKDRMEKLGVTDIFDGYSNILVGCDYLSYLIDRYGDVSYALMKYNGDSRADNLYKEGKMSNYASNILSLQENLHKVEYWGL